MNPLLALFIANVIWGGASPIFKYSLENIPPFTLAFIRFFFASFLFLPFVFKYFKQLNTKLFLKILIASFFGITLNISAFFLGLQRTDSINAPIIASAGPVFIFLLSVFFLKERASKRVFGGMMAALMGVLVIILSPVFLEGKGYAMGEIIGNLLFVLAMFGAVFNTVMNKDILKRTNPILLTYIGFLFGALTFFPFMMSELRTWSFASLNGHGWTGILYGVFLSSAAAYYLHNFAIQKVNAQEVGLFTYIDPIAAVVIAIPLLGEYPNLYFIAGSILVFGGLYFAEGRLPWHYHIRSIMRGKFNRV